MQDDEYSGIRLEQLEAALVYYREYAEEIAQLPIIEIDTTNKSIEETVHEILEKVEAYEQNNNR
jgi:broad-specificity NMP kinase